VARLVAEGLNNSQVAARMYISTHTVAHHLRQAFRKLSIASRVELARIVIEQAADGPADLATGLRDRVGEPSVTPPGPQPDFSERTVVSATVNCHPRARDHS